MKSWMLRRPENLLGTEAKYMPNAPLVVLITLGIYAGYMLAAIVLALIYGNILARFAFSENFLDWYMDAILIFVLLSTIVCIWFTLIHVKRTENRSLHSIGLMKPRFARRWLLGVAAGAVVLLISLLPNFIEQKVRYTGVETVALLYLAGFAVQSASEEILFRGYMLTALLRRNGTLFAVMISSLTFTAMHLFNGIGLLDLVSIFLLGALFALVTLRTGSLWPAMGMHFGWNFITGCLTPVAISGYRFDYAFFRFLGFEPKPLVSFAVMCGTLLAACALVLFAGKWRLVVRMDWEDRLYFTALRLAKRTLKGTRANDGRPYINREIKLSAAVEGKAIKALALLHYALETGRVTPYRLESYGFKGDILTAAQALYREPGEDYESYSARTAQNAIAAYIKAAELALTEREQGVAAPVLQYCPMLRWKITPEHCRRIIDAVDGRPSTPAEQDLISSLDTRLCENCPARGQRSKDANTAALEEPSHLFCPECGYSIEADSKFCPGCGANLKE